MSNHTHRDRAEVSGNHLRPRWLFQKPSLEEAELEHLLTDWADDLKAQASTATLPSRASLLKRVQQQEAGQSPGWVAWMKLRGKSSE